MRQQVFSPDSVLALKPRQKYYPAYYRDLYLKLKDYYEEGKIRAGFTHDKFRFLLKSDPGVPPYQHTSLVSGEFLEFLEKYDIIKQRGKRGGKYAIKNLKGSLEDCLEKYATDKVKEMRQDF